MPATHARNLSVATGGLVCQCSTANCKKFLSLRAKSKSSLSLTTRCVPTHTASGGTVGWRARLECVPGWRCLPAPCDCARSRASLVLSACYCAVGQDTKLRSLSAGPRAAASAQRRRRSHPHLLLSHRLLHVLRVCPALGASYRGRASEILLP